MSSELDLEQLEKVARERVQREWFEPGRSFAPEVVLALIARLREAEAEGEML